MCMCIVCGVYVHSVCYVCVWYIDVVCYGVYVIVCCGVRCVMYVVWYVCVWSGVCVSVWVWTVTSIVDSGAFLKQSFTLCTYTAYFLKWLPSFNSLCPHLVCSPFTNSE